MQNEVYFIFSFFQTSTSFRPLKIGPCGFHFFFSFRLRLPFSFFKIQSSWNMECTTISSVVLGILLTKIFTQLSFSVRIQFFYLIPWKMPWNTTLIVSPKYTGDGAIHWSSSHLVVPLHSVGRETGTNSKNHYLALCFKMHPKKLVQLVD